MLLPHNINVFNELEQTLQENNCCCVVMGTGCGKTYVTLEYLNKHNLKALIVSPRKSISESWKKHSKNIETVTYQKFANIYNTIDFSKYDVLVCDEVHHIGAPKWGAPIKHIIDNNIIKVIGLTESSIRYTDGARDVAKDYFYDNVAYGENVTSAIEKNILNPVVYVGAMYNSDGLKKTLRGKIQSRLYAKLNLVLNNTPNVTEILKKHMLPGKRKGIIFASSIEDIESAIKFVKSVYPDVEIKQVHSKQSSSYNDQVFDWFKNTDEGYLCSVDMISEGIHIKGVNTLIMLRRTESVNLFNQQLGRCLDANSKEQAILFDLVNNKYSVKIVQNKVSIKSDNVFDVKKINVVPSKQMIVHDYTKDIIDVLEEIKMNLERRWTEEEDELVKNFYKKNPSGRGCKEFVKNNFKDRTVAAVSNRAIFLGLTQPFAVPYTEEETEIVKKYYPIEGPNCYKRLTNRTKDAVVKFANSIGITANRFLSEEEIEIIKKYYPTEGSKVLKRLPNRNINSVRNMARKLGVKSISNYWTEEEDNLLKENFYKLKGTKLQALLPNRSLSSISKRANDLGMRKERTKVRCVETGEVFDNASDAARKMGIEANHPMTSITRVCKGIRPTAYGYHWEYVE